MPFRFLREGRLSVALTWRVIIRAMRSSRYPYVRDSARKRSMPRKLIVEAHSRLDRLPTGPDGGDEHNREAPPSIRARRCRRQPRPIPAPVARAGHTFLKIGRRASAPIARSCCRSHKSPARRASSLDVSQTSITRALLAIRIREVSASAAIAAEVGLCSKRDRSASQRLHNLTRPGAGLEGRRAPWRSLRRQT